MVGDQKNKMIMTSRPGDAMKLYSSSSGITRSGGG